MHRGIRISAIVSHITDMWRDKWDAIPPLSTFKSKVAPAKEILVYLHQKILCFRSVCTIQPRFSQNNSNVLSLCLSFFSTQYLPAQFLFGLQELLTRNLGWRNDNNEIKWKLLWTSKFDKVLSAATHNIHKIFAWY